MRHGRHGIVDDLRDVSRQLREVTAERDQLRETLRQVVWRDCAGRAWIAHDLDAVLRRLLDRHPELFKED